MITDCTDRRRMKNIVHNFPLISRGSEEPGEGQLPALWHPRCVVCRMHSPYQSAVRKSSIFRKELHYN